MSLRLPAEKLAELRMLVAEWLGKRSCMAKELESLVGKLQHATKVIRPGRTFLRRMFELLRGARRGQRFLRLNAAFRSDLQWWHLFMAQWNGVTMMGKQHQALTGPQLYSDASGTFGCGAWWGEQWFQLPWPQGDNGYTSIAPKELLPIVIAGFLWGASWRGQLVTAHCDNMAVVEVVNSGYSKDGVLAQLLRVLFFVKAYWEVEVKAVHIPGEQNVLADALSRNYMGLFFSQVPTSSRTPIEVPRQLVELLVTVQPDWMSPAWPRWFTSCLQQVWPLQPEEQRRLVALPSQQGKIQ